MYFKLILQNKQNRLHNFLKLGFNLELKKMYIT